MNEMYLYKMYVHSNRRLFTLYFICHSRTITKCSTYRLEASFAKKVHVNFDISNTATAATKTTHDHVDDDRCANKREKNSSGK